MLLSTAYLPPISYFKKIATSEKISIEKHEHFVKQTYRNRCLIYGANGVQPLSIPLINTHEKTLITEKRIAYKENWQNQHWRSIESAYRGSPYFIYYADEFKIYYEKKYDLLFEFNTEILQTILKMMKLKREIVLTESYLREQDNDYRSLISPKLVVNDKEFLPYTQVFSDKHRFKPDLSIIDLIFNLGPDSIKYLNS